MGRRIIRRNSGFQTSRPLDYVYDREWITAPDVFAQDASKALRALSTVVVRPDFKTMFTNSARHSVSIIPDKAAAYGMFAYRHLQWSKRASRRPPVDVGGRDSFRFRVRSCPRAVTNMQEAEADSSAVRSTWRGHLRLPLTPIRHRRAKEERRNVVITESKMSLDEEEGEEEERTHGRHTPDRHTLLQAALEEANITGASSVVKGELYSPGRPRSKRGSFSDSRSRIKGLSPSEETLILLNRYERHVIREAWNATLPAKDSTHADFDRRIQIQVELEKDKWNLRTKEIEAINRARYLLDEREKNKKASLLNDFHQRRLKRHRQVRAKMLEVKMHALRRKQERAVRILYQEMFGREKRRPNKDPIEFLVDPGSDGFAPQQRFGDDPSRWHEYLPNRGKTFKNPKVVEEMEECVVEHWKPSKYELAPSKEPETPELCVHLTKWTPAKLKKLHNDLKDMRKLSNRIRCKFKPREWSQRTQIDEDVNGTTDILPRFIPLQEAKMLRAIMILQKILRARAVQAIMYEGRRHNRELIREILSSSPFDTGEGEPDLASHGLAASTGWPRLKTYDEYSSSPVQEKWVQNVLSTLPPTLDVYNLMDFVNMNLMKIRENIGSGHVEDGLLEALTPWQSTSETHLSNKSSFISCGMTRPGKHKLTASRQRKPARERNISEESFLGRFIAHARPRQSRQRAQHESREQPDVSAITEGTSRHIPRIDTQTIQETPDGIEPVTPNSLSTNVVYAAASIPSTTDTIAAQGEPRGIHSQRSAVEIHGRSSSHVGFRAGIWTCRSPPNEFPRNGSEDTVTAISRFTGEDFTDRRHDEDLSAIRHQPSGCWNVSASASEETPSTDDTHIITDDATELVAAAFRAKVREQGNTLAAQRIDEAPSPTDSITSSPIPIPILGRSVSQQRAPAAMIYTSSEEQACRTVQTTSTTTITTGTDTSESSWTLNESKQINITRRLREKNRNRELHVHSKSTGVIGGKTNTVDKQTRLPSESKVEVNEDKDDLSK